MTQFMKNDIYEDGATCNMDMSSGSSKITTPSQRTIFWCSNDILIFKCCMVMIGKL